MENYGIKLQNFDSSKLTKSQYNVYKKVLNFTNYGKDNNKGVSYAFMRSEDSSNYIRSGFFLTKLNDEFNDVIYSDKLNVNTVKVLVRLGILIESSKSVCDKTKLYILNKLDCKD